MRRLQRLLDSMPVVLYRTSADGRIIETNAAAVEMFGYDSKQDLLSIPVTDTYAEPDDRESHLEERRQQDGRVRSVLRLRRRDGSTFWALDISRAMFEDGDLAYTEGVLQDITDLVEAREALHLDEEAYRTIHDLSPTAILGIDPKGRVFRMNRAAERLFACAKQDLVGKTFGDITHPDDREASRQGFWDLLEGKTDEVDLEKRYVRLDGKIIWAEVRAVAVREEDGSLRHIISLINDVTESHRHLEELELFNRIVRAMEDEADLEGAYEAVLRSLCEHTGWSIGEAWEMGEDGELHCMRPHYIARDGLQKFRRISERVTFAPGHGLPGQAFERREAVWSTDLTADRTFTRGASAIAAGLTAGLGVPVLVGDEPLAVLDFLMDDVGPEDEGRISLVSALAVQLGATAQRHRDVEKMRRSHRLLAAAAEHCDEAFVVLGLDGDVLACDRAFLRICGVLPDGDPRSAEEVLPEVREGRTFQDAVEYLYMVTQKGGKDQVEWQDTLYQRRSVPLKGSDGTVEGRLLYFRKAMDLA